MSPAPGKYLINQDPILYNRGPTIAHIEALMGFFKKGWKLHETTLVLFFLLATMAAQAQSSFVARLDSTFMPSAISKPYLDHHGSLQSFIDPHIELLTYLFVFAIVIKRPG